jgi:hypothetical protein
MLRCIQTGLYLAFIGALNCGAVIIDVDPQATYLRMSPMDVHYAERLNGAVARVATSGAPASLPIDLDALGFAPGDLLTLQRLGGFMYDYGWNGGTREAYGMVGVFSATDELLPFTEAHRVPGALPATLGFPTRDSYYPALSTDIPEDFLITGEGVTLKIPEGAAYLLVTADDIFFWDNAPGANGFQLSLQQVSSPVPDAGGLLPVTVLTLLGLGLARRRS